jgi:enoyl-CoA hydratase
MAETANRLDTFETLIYRKENGVGYVTLNRPEALNAFNVRMRDDLFEVLNAVRDDREIRVVIITGAGEKAFCAGADLTEFLTAPPPVAARDVRWERDLWGVFLSIAQPVIVALHGFVLGDGVEIAMCCDIRIASDDARFGMPEAGLGIIPAAGGTQTLSRVAGLSAANELILTGHWIKANEARRLKMVNKVVPRKELMPTVEKLGREIASYDPLAVRAAKQAVISGIETDLKHGLELETLLSHSIS